MDDATRHRDGIVVSGYVTAVKTAALSAIQDAIGLANMNGEDFQFLAHIDNYGHMLADRHKSLLQEFNRPPAPTAGMPGLGSATEVPETWVSGANWPGLAEEGVSFAEETADDLSPGLAFDPPREAARMPSILDEITPRPRNFKTPNGLAEPDGVQFADDSAPLPADAPDYTKPAATQSAVEEARAVAATVENTIGRPEGKDFN